MWYCVMYLLLQFNELQNVDIFAPRVTNPSRLEQNQNPSSLGTSLNHPNVYMTSTYIQQMFVSSAAHHSGNVSGKKYKILLSHIFSIYSYAWSCMNFILVVVQTSMKVPGVQTGRIWLFGIFRYDFNLKCVVKNENERIVYKLLMDLNFSFCW